jgi:uncharacterized protein YegL
MNEMKQTIQNMKEEINKDMEALKTPKISTNLPKK